MAWQLIYTSAPRLLEAGRSGFGSVARHRQISPLLVSAVERASQFSRQPGMDPARVIYSHRIIPISGARFHVLSCTRDAGADYTGRTNHIAHHVIAEAREVAKLRSQAASPADVLLTIPWTARWDEPPRFLEPDEELDLADYAPRTSADGEHWAAATGKPEHAWLLAAGEASRGAYVIPPAHTDLRWLFADSLRLAPERLWQTSFTTSLQSKDEITDFRWIGIESDSPLRPETSASGRPTLDLKSPASLPQPEIPVAQVAQVAQAPQSLADSVKLKTPVNGASESAPGAAEQLFRRPELPAQKARRAPERHPQWDEGACHPGRLRLQVSHWAWMMAAVGLMAVACLGFFFVTPLTEQLGARKRVASALEPSDYFGDGSARAKIAWALLPNWRPDSKSFETAKASADSMNRIAFALMQGNLEGIHPEDIAALKGFVGGAATPPPGEITRLFSLLTAAKAQETNLRNPPLNSAAGAFNLQQSSRDAVNKAIPNPPYGRLNKALRELSDAQIAKAEYDLLARNASIQPPEGVAIFQKSLDDLRVPMSDNKEALEFLNKAAEILELWKLTEIASSHPDAGSIAALKRKLDEKTDKRPEWLSKRISTLAKADEDTFASALPAAAKTSSPAPSALLYFVSDIESLRTAQFKGLRKNLTYFLSSPGDGKPRKLLDPAKDGKLWLSIRDRAQAFAVNEDPPQMIPGAAAADLGMPFVLSGRDDADKEVLRIYVAAASDKPLFPPTRNLELTRAGDSLNIDLQKLPLPGLMKDRLEIKLPDDCAIAGKSAAPLALNNGKVDIGGAIKGIREEREANAREIENLKGALAHKREDPRAGFANRKYLVIQTAKLDAELQKKDSQAAKDLGGDSAPLFQQCGNLIVAVTRSAHFSGADKLFEIGKRLAKLSPDADDSVKNESLSVASEMVAVAPGLAIG